ncbi:MAG: DUF3795 domain-containing protein [Candidatus Brocadiia bacterium]
MIIPMAYCGIECSKCEAYLATVANDDALRAKVAEKWGAQFNPDIKPADINCMGCTSTSEPVFQWCRMCPIRACATERKVPNCGHCGDFPCEKVEFVLKAAPGARERLEAEKPKK